MDARPWVGFSIFHATIDPSARKPGRSGAVRRIESSWERVKELQEKYGEQLAAARKPVNAAQIVTLRNTEVLDPCGSSLLLWRTA